MPCGLGYVALGRGAECFETLGLRILGHKPEAFGVVGIQGFGLIVGTEGLEDLGFRVEGLGLRV